MVAVLVVAFAVLYYGYQQLSSQYVPESAGGNETRQEAPDFTLVNSAGEAVSLSDFRGQAVILNFWASWCPPCKSEMPYFDALSDEYEASGEAVFLMINLTDGGQETIESASQYLDESGYTLNVLFDTEGDAADKYGVSSIPTTFMIDKDGFIRNMSVGAVSESALAMEVTKLLTMQEE